MTRDEQWPRTLGPYQVQSLLGRGAMGAVLQAEHRELKRSVAIKVLRSGHQRMRELRHRFRREALAMSLIDHPNIVGILDAELDHDPPYLVMELVEGRSLEGSLGPTARPWERADVLDMGTQLAQGLAAIHRAGLVHRDLKPANVLHDEARDAYRIADLGLAGGHRFTVLTKEGDILGTPAYLAPETWVGEGATQASDVFQVGVMLYEAWTGSAPYGRDLESLMVNVQRGLAPDDPIGTEPLAQVIRGCLEVDATRRYASGRELLRALQAVERADRSQEGTGRLEVLPAPPPVAAPEAPARSRSWGLPLLLAAGIGLGAGVFRRSRDSVATPPPEASPRGGRPPPEEVRALRPEGLRVLVEGPDVELVFRTAAPRRTRLVVDGGGPRAEGPETRDHRLRVGGLPVVGGWPRAALELVASQGTTTRWPLPGGLDGHAELLAEQVGELSREVWELAREPWHAGRLGTSAGRLALVEELVQRGLVDRAARLGRGVRAFLADQAHPMTEKWLLYQAHAELATLETIGPRPRRSRPLLGVEAWLEPLVQWRRVAAAPEGAAGFPARGEDRPVELAPRELVRAGGPPEWVGLASELAVQLPAPPDDRAVLVMVELAEAQVPGLVLELEGAADLRLPPREAMGSAGELVGWRLAPGAYGPRTRRAVLRLRPPVPGVAPRAARVRALYVWAESPRVHSGP